MGLFNPVYALLIPSLVFVTIPLAILAGLTTTLAFSVLILRVIVVYLDIALSVVPQSLAGRGTASLQQRLAASRNAAKTLPYSQSPSPLRSSIRHRRRRSSVSALSGGSTSSLSASERGPGLIPSIGPEREFEGIGGWRLGDDDDDELWTTVNALPDRSLGRHHGRTSSTGPTTPGEGGYLMMKGRTHSPEARKAASPNCSRARTPTGPRVGFATTNMNQNEGGYFALVRAKQ
uniref:Uncharacterized protein n=1 Tax=Bionectria ochroleuca TaxID=29856 RepID=A0A8H7ND73_BIOOC